MLLLDSGPKTVFKAVLLLICSSLFGLVGACSPRPFVFYFALHGAVHALVYGIYSPFWAGLCWGECSPALAFCVC